MSHAPRLLLALYSILYPSVKAHETAEQLSNREWQLHEFSTKEGHRHWRSNDTNTVKSDEMKVDKGGRRSVGGKSMIR